MNIPPNKLGIFAYHSEDDKPFSDEEMLKIINGPIAAAEPKLMEELNKMNDEEFIVDKTSGQIVSAEDAKNAESLIKLNKYLQSLAELVLTFHSGSPWDLEKETRWNNNLNTILGIPADRPKIWNGFHYIEHGNEATIKNLCNAAQKVLEILK